MQYPKEFLKKAYEIVRENGGLCIADEVTGVYTHAHTHMHNCIALEKLAVASFHLV